MEHMDLLTFLVNALDQALVGLKRAGYSWDDGEFTALESDMEDPESFYYRKVLEDCAGIICERDETLHRSSRKPKKETFRLRRLPNGRFGYMKPGGINVEMSSGRRIEALVHLDGHPCWMDCQIEYDEDYYLCRYYEPLEGLLVREVR